MCRGGLTGVSPTWGLGSCDHGFLSLADADSFGGTGRAAVTDPRSVGLTVHADSEPRLSPEKVVVFIRKREDVAPEDVAAGVVQSNVALVSIERRSQLACVRARQGR